MAKRSTSAPSMTTVDKFDLVRTRLNKTLIERDEEIDLVLVALLAGEHPLLVGPPGTAKSLLLDSMAKWVRASKFDYLLTRFTDPMELFGPVDIVALKERRSERVVKGMMPEATMVFMDEIFKASSAILNTMLKILNERKFKYGQQELECPLRICVAASNEWPDQQEDLGALFDRFLLRKHVHPISESGLDRLLWTSNHQAEFETYETITAEELDQAQEEVEAIEWSDRAKTCLRDIIRELRSNGIQPGDRRMFKSVKVAAAMAWLEGSDEVEPEHLEILKHCLWVDPEQAVKTGQIVSKLANPVGFAINEKMGQATEVLAKNTATEAVPKLQEILKALQAMDDSKRQRAACEWVSQKIKQTYNRVIGLE